MVRSRVAPTSLLLLTCLVLSVHLRAQEDPVKAAVRSVKEKYAPDRRVVVFDITTEAQAGNVVVKGDVDDAGVRDALLAAIRSAGAASVIDSVRVLPDPAFGDRTYGVVTVSVGNVRTRPAEEEELSTQVLMGMTVRLLKMARGYNYVQMPDRYLGWLDRMSVRAMTKAEADAWSAAPKVIMTGYFGMVREHADGASMPICDLVAGGILKADGTEGTWTAVELADGRRGFVESSLVEDYDQWKKSRRLTGESLARTAKMFVGIPYLWGGTSCKGMDCSGFVKTVYRLNGMELNRDASQQAQIGADIPVGPAFENARTGDLMFFGQKASADRPERITHVALYLGDRLFIHSSGRVRISSFDPASPQFEESLLKRFVRARRIIPDPAPAKP